MNWKTTAFLLAVALGMGIFFFFGYSKFKGTGDAEGKEKLLISEEDMKEVTRIELKTEKEELVLENRGKPGEEQWRFVKPATVPAGKSAVPDLLGAARRITVDSVLSPDQQPTPQGAGLDRPRLTASFVTPTKKFVLRFGKDTGFQDETVWAQKEGDPQILPVPKFTFERLNKKFIDMRDKDMARYEEWKVDKIVMARKFQRPGQNGLEDYYEDFELARGDKGWQYTRPAAEAADDSAVSGFLRALLSISAEDFVPKAENLDEFGLAKPDLKVEVFEKGAAKPVTVHFGRRLPGDTKKMYVMNPAHGDLSVILAERYERLPKDRDDFRSKAIFSVRAEQAHRVTITLPWKTVEMAREEKEIEKEVEKDGKREKVKEKVTEWVLKKPEGAAIRKEMIEPFVRYLLGMQVSAFLVKDAADLKIFHLDPPLATLRIFYKNASGVDDTQTIHVGAAPAGSKAYMVKPPEKQVCELAVEHLDILKAGDLNFMDPLVLDIKKENIVSFIVQLGETQFQKAISYACEKEPNGNWKWAESAREQWKGFELDPDKVNNLMLRLSQIRVQKFVSDQPEDAEKYTLNRPEATLTLRFEKDEGGTRKMHEKSLVISPKVGYNTMAKFVDSPVVFQLDAFYADALKEGVYKKPQGPDGPGHDH